MPQGLFTDKTVQPTAEDIRKGLRDAVVLWDDLAEFARQNFTVKEEWKFYGTNYGWALRFRKGGKALVSLYPCHDSLKAQVVLNESAVKRSLKLPLGVRLTKKIREAHPYPDGRWLFLDVKTLGDAERIKKLIKIKAEK